MRTIPRTKLALVKVAPNTGCETQTSTPTRSGRIRDIRHPVVADISTKTRFEAVVFVLAVLILAGAITVGLVIVLSYLIWGRVVGY